MPPRSRSRRGRCWPAPDRDADHDEGGGTRGAPPTCIAAAARPDASPVWDRGHRRGDDHRGGREAECDARGDEQQAREHRDRVRGARGCERQPEVTGCKDEEAHDQAALRPDGTDHSRQDDQRDDEPGQRGGDHGEASLLRSHRQDLLEVEGDEDERGGSGHLLREGRGDVPMLSARDRKSSRGNQGIRGSALDRDERRHQDDGGAEQAATRGRGPGVVDSVDSTVHQSDHRSR